MESGPLPAASSTLVFEPESEPPDAPEVTRRRPSASIDPLKLVLFPVRAFLALGWLRASAEKAISLDWWRGIELRTYLDEQAAEALPFMAVIGDRFFDPLAVPIAIGVMFVQFMIGICFATAHNLRPALYAALTLNLTFVAMGSVTPSAFYLAIQLSLLVAVRQWRQPPLRRRRSAGIIAANVATAVALVPFIATIHPAEVIHDPALMLITIAILAACSEALRWVEYSDASTGTRSNVVQTT